MEPSDLVAVVPPWAKQPSNHPQRNPLRRNPPRQARSRTPAPTRRNSEEKSEFVEVIAEGGDHVEPPPPEIVETDPELSPEEAEQVRKDYLLKRFWISARGYWGKNGDRLAWMFTIGLLLLIVANVGFQYGINVWNRAIFDAIEKRDSATVISSPRCSFRSRSAACCSACAGLRPHGHPAPLARLADQCGDHRAGWRTAATISSIWSAAITRIRNIASPRICGSRPIRRSISSPASPRRFCRPRPSSSCCGPSAAR